MHTLVDLVLNEQFPEHLIPAVREMMRQLPQGGINANAIKNLLSCLSDSQCTNDFYNDAALLLRKFHNKTN